MLIINFLISCNPYCAQPRKNKIAPITIIAYPIGVEFQRNFPHKVRCVSGAPRIGRARRQINPNPITIPPTIKSGSSRTDIRLHDRTINHAIIVAKIAFNKKRAILCPTGTCSIVCCCLLMSITSSHFFLFFNP